MSNRVWSGAFFGLLISNASLCDAAEISRAQALRVTAAAVQPVMEKNQILGIAVGLVLQDQTYVFNFGVASLADERPVTDATIFEVGSVSKTFTATLASYAEGMGKLQLSARVASYLPELADTDFGRLQLYHLATHTAGGFPLQVPDEIRNEQQLLSYFRAWKPAYKTGAMRTYANPSIGMLGLIAAKSMGQDFSAAMSQSIFEPLGLRSTYLNVPAEQLVNYAFGYNQSQAPVRVSPGMLSNEAYGVKTTAQDLSRFVQANMGLLNIGRPLQVALDNTRKGYFKVGAMTQDLIWEEYGLPVNLHTLQNGNSPVLILSPTPVDALVPPVGPRSNVWVNKTGSTNGFGAYVAFIPSQHVGIVLLANKNYPNSERVALAQKIFAALYP